MSAHVSNGCTTHVQCTCKPVHIFSNLHFSGFGLIQVKTRGVPPFLHVELCFRARRFFSCC